MSKRIIITQIVFGMVWILSGIGKILSGKFVSNISDIIKWFASNNPFGFYKSFLEVFAIPNAEILGMLIMWSEVFAGIILVISANKLRKKKDISSLKWLTIFSLLVFMFMNINFWLAAGWINIAFYIINALMFAIEVILLYNWLKSGLSQAK